MTKKILNQILKLKKKLWLLTQSINLPFLNKLWLVLMPKNGNFPLNLKFNKDQNMSKWILKLNEMLMKLLINLKFV